MLKRLQIASGGDQVRLFSLLHMAVKLLSAGGNICSPREGPRRKRSSEVVGMKSLI